MNSKNGTALQSIIIKYFEKGHTFMSADSYHHLVELAMARMKKVYDFKDFCDALENDGTLMVIKSTDFLQVPRGLSENSKFAENHPKMDVIRIAKFVRGSTKIF